jgi:hypothetical protein
VFLWYVLLIESQTLYNIPGVIEWVVVSHPHCHVYLCLGHTASQGCLVSKIRIQCSLWVMSHPGCPLLWALHGYNRACFVSGWKWQISVGAGLLWLWEGLVCVDVRTHVLVTRILYSESIFVEGDGWHRWWVSVCASMVPCVMGLILLTKEDMWIIIVVRGRQRPEVVQNVVCLSVSLSVQVVVHQLEDTAVAHWL